MKDEITNQLEAILDKRQADEQAAAVGSPEKQKAEDRNLADFYVKRREVILPAFQEIVDLYGRRGIRILIDEQTKKPHDEPGGFPVPNIRLDMYEAHSSVYRNMRPEFRLSFDKDSRKVSLYTSTGSQSGPAGHVTLDDLTADWIQVEFVKYQSKSF